MNFQIAGESNIGLVRKNNEDNFFLLVHPFRETAFAVVADGIGGHDYGEIASFVCCRDFGKAYWNSTDADLKPSGAGKTFLAREIEHINRRVFLRNRSEQLLRPMGCTVVALLLLPETAVFANAGDSRLYRARTDGSFQQLSCDHTIDVPLANYEDCSGSIISMAVGPRPNIHPLLQECKLQEGDRFLLCTDGASRYLEDSQIREFLTQADSPRAAVDAVLRESLIAGGRDNITAVAAFVAAPRKE